MPLTRPSIPPLPTLHTLYHPLTPLLHTRLTLTTSPPPPSIPSISLAHSLALIRLHPLDRFLSKLNRDIEGFAWYLDHRDDYREPGSEDEPSITLHNDIIEELEVLHDAVVFHGEKMAEVEGVKTGLRVWANEGKMGVLRGRKSEGDGVGKGEMEGGFVRRGVDGGVGGLGLTGEQVGWVGEERVAKMVETQGVVEEMKWRIGEARRAVEGKGRRKTW